MNISWRDDFVERPASKRLTTDYTTKGLQAYSPAVLLLMMRSSWQREIPPRVPADAGLRLGGLLPRNEINEICVIHNSK
jgi:hypothetical protein